MKIDFSLFNGKSAPSEKFVSWIPGWWYFATGLPIEKGGLSNGDQWLLFGGFYSKESPPEIINQFQASSVERLLKADGEFIFALYYKDEDAVRIFRDRTGLLPLNYTQEKFGNAFCLWINSLGEIIKNKEVASQAVLRQWPLFRGTIAPDTHVNGIRQLSGRYSLIIKDNKIALEDVPLPSPGAKPYHSLNHASSDLGMIFSKAVKKRITDKFRIGATLSGGNDSSLLAAVLREHYCEALRTVFVTFEDYERNYGQDAYKVAQKCKSNHSEIVLSPKNYLNLWPETISICQAPINHPCTIGQTAAFDMLSREVDVVFSGKGADTVFGGPFWSPFLFLSYGGAFLSNSMRKKMRALSLKVGCNTSLAKLMSKSLGAIGTPLREYVFSESTFGNEDTVDQVFAPGTWQGTMESCQKYIKKNPLVDLFFFETLDWHPVTYDAEKKLCFSFGLIPLYPFLDYELMKSSLRLPIYLRYYYRTKKAALKKYSENFFSDEFIYKPKEGFGVPLGKWFSLPAYSSLLNLPLEERALRRQWWNEKKLKEIIHLHQNGMGTDSSAETIPWITINLELWARICLEGDSPKLYMI